MIRTLLLATFVTTILAIEPSDVQATPKAFDKTMRQILKPYLEIHKALASDSIKGVNVSAKKMAKLIRKLKTSGIKGKKAKLYRTIPKELKKAIAELRKRKKLKEVRESYKVLSQPMVSWVKLSQIKDVIVVHCSMTKGSWLQLTKPVLNPYHGSEMLHCGQIISPK